MKYDADYFIRFFEAIPDRKWCVGHFKYQGRHCAEGFLQRGDMKEFNSLLLIFKDCFGSYPSAVNDSFETCPARFRKFKRPRTRVLHALREAKAKGY